MEHVAVHLDLGLKKINEQVDIAFEAKAVTRRASSAGPACSETTRLGCPVRQHCSMISPHLRSDASCRRRRPRPFERGLRLENRADITLSSIVAADVVALNSPRRRPLARPLVSTITKGSSH